MDKRNALEMEPRNKEYNVPTTGTHGWSRDKDGNHRPLQSPRSQLRKTGKVTQTSMFRTNKIALIFMRFEQNEFKLFF